MEVLEEKLVEIWDLVRVLDEKLVVVWDFDVDVAVKADEGELGDLKLTFLETAFSSLITETTQRFIPVGLRIIRVQDVP